MSNPNAPANVESQYRTMLILWVAFLSSIAMYFFIALVVPAAAQTANGLLTIIFNATSAFLVVVSFAVKKKFLSQAVDEQKIGLVNKGFILAAAFCEAAALFGLLDLFVAQDRYYFVLIAFAFLGLLLHFPRRIYLESASFKSGHQLN
jgi:F0F1-type ATP synthase membrane subunit c/vacuolar-type H+-ATPase subunit K